MFRSFVFFGLAMSISFAGISTSLCAQAIEINVEKRIRLEASGDADVWMWQAPSALTIEQHGHVLLVEGPAGSYRVQVTALSIDWDDRRLTQRTGFIDFAIGQVPKPDDPDEPDVDDRFGLIAITIQAIESLTSVDKSRQVEVRMPDGNVVAISAIEAVSTVYFDTAELIRQGELIDPQMAIDHVRRQNQRILADDPGNWPAVFQAIGQAANEMWIDGDIATIGDWAIAFDEISKGMKRAR